MVLCRMLITLGQVFIENDRYWVYSLEVYTGLIKQDKIHNMALMVTLYHKIMILLVVLFGF